MKKILVKLGKNSYEIRTGPGILPLVGSWLKEKGFSGKAVIITDATVKKLYAGVLEHSLARYGFSATVIDVPAGEAQKTLETAGKLYYKLAEVFTERTTPILALGGGVIGDLAGFVAATYMRGVPFVQVPTTLLAQVDSSIGGKTAVDHGQIKNIVGVFYQPALVVADIDTLKTLPAVEFSNGMAEVIKTAAILDMGFFSYLEEKMEKAASFDTEVLNDIVVKSAALKSDVVMKDEKESGLRVILNYGHTIGHAVEAVSDFRIKHGPAVAIGMSLENKIACRMGLMDEREAVRINGLIKRAGLPAELPDFTDGQREKVLELIKHDKKVTGNRTRFVLIRSIGNTFITEKVEPEIIREVLFG
jgi:3-dehydroquinate synthase